jgi:ammonia channel protein AmtB
LPFFVPFDDHLLNYNPSLVIMATAAAASAKIIFDWIAAHPYQTAFHVANGVILVTPAAATVPILSAMGFSATGPVAGE